MLDLRPSCENCQRALPPESTEAMICSLECTFCQSCVQELLQNVCPNCGGGLCARPIRPRHDWNGYHLGNRPPNPRVVHKAVDPEVHRAFSARLAHIPPEQR